MTKPLRRGFEEPVRRHARGVASQFAVHGGFGDRVERVEQEVGFVRTELVAVVIGVAATVVMCAGPERNPSEQVDPDEIIDPTIGEQQSVRRLMVQDVHPGLDVSHHHRGWNDGPPRSDGDDGTDHRDGSHENGEHGQRVPEIRNGPELSTEFGTRSEVLAEAAGPGELGAWLCRCHTAGHGGYQLVVGGRGDGHRENVTELELRLTDWLL